MKHRLRQLRADMVPGADSPLNFAVNRRDKATLDMVTHAVKHNQTMLAYQPIVQARATKKPAFYEALIRVLDDTGRVIPAGDFMPVVENTQLGREIDCVALEMGLRTLARNPNLRLSINMSARSIGYKRWMRILDRILRKDASLGGRLILEITESSAMAAPELVIDFMSQLQGRGIAFAMDDFGAGYTAFRHFRDFYFDAVKIDGQFVRGIQDSPDNQVLVQALIAIAQQFDMLTVAESVETVQEAEFLVAAGIDSMQGYLFGAPTIRPPWIPQKASQQVA